MASKGDIHVGVVGLGDGGLCNVHGLCKVAGVEITAFCDSNPQVLRESRKKFCLPAWSGYGDFRNLVSDPGVDLVIVATPDHDHLAVARVALEAGKHVFVEKPVATALDDLRIFIALSRAYRGKLWFSENHSFTPQIEVALGRREALGEFMIGSTFYTMPNCDRIMGGGKWRTETAYNPCAGGLSHNFMTALLFSGAPIARVAADGQALTYKELEGHGGFDTMEGVIQFANGRYLNWLVCLAVSGQNSLFGHRSITHALQFRNGCLTYSPVAENDRLVIGGKPIAFAPEPPAEALRDYLTLLYRRMHEDIIAAICGDGSPRHTIEQGINVAAACALAFESAKQGGVLLEVPF